MSSKRQLMLRGESSVDESSRLTYHVFLSFRRNEGSHLEFTRHLIASLERKGITTFPYDRDHHYVTLQELHKAIEESLAVIVVFSENYASSTLCLDELEKIILESKRVPGGREVFPVFYDVTPADVRYQISGFGEAFSKHAASSEEDKRKVQKWRDSLQQVAGISGWAWESKNRHKEELIEDIITSVWTKIHPKIPINNDGLVGIDYKVRKMQSLLRIELEDVRFIGIWGMGGIGKTTLARVVFNKIRNKFDVSCFLHNVRKICAETNGMLRLQRTLLSHLKLEGLEVEDLGEGKSKIQEVLFNKKVLLVIDDVDDVRHLESLVERKEWFGYGSRVIITTRDMQLLTSYGMDESTYKIDFLNSEESIQLFSQKAFKCDQPQEPHLELSKFVVQYSGGLPLALERLGSFLCGREESQWKEVLDKIKECPENDIIMEKLRISYDRLPERYKALFLDIACFFNGWVKEHVIQILTICERYPPDGIKVLIDKSLATYDGFHLGMHDLHQEMGRKIVIEECITDAGKRSRLWSLEDIDLGLKNNKVTDLIQGIVLKSSTQPYKAIWDPKVFLKMNNLKFLIINFHNMHLPLSLKCLCSSLKVLQWMGYPLEALPLGVQLDEVVDLKMCHSKIKKIWKGNQTLTKLKFIDLSHSKDLIQTPIVSGAPCLESLLLEGCINLVKVHRSVAKHKKLVVLNLKDCINLQILPRKLEMDSLEEFILSGCSKVKNLPKFGKNMKSLSWLNLEDSNNLLYLPNFTCNLKSLRILNIYGCSKISKLPNNMNENESLEELHMNGSAIREITSSKVCLGNLKDLSFGGRIELASNSCNLLQWILKFKKQPIPIMELILPPLSHLSRLKFLDLSYCDLKDESIPGDLGSLSFLQGLDLSGNNFVNPPTHCISNLSMLQSLTITDCPMLESLPMLPPNVQCLFATNCTQMKPLNLDAQMLWNIFESHMNQMEDKPHLWFIIPGREIPPWFDNKKYDLINPLHHPYNKLGCDSFASIKVEVPNHCGSSKWWGIAICLVLEPTNIQQSPSHVRPTSMVNEETCIYYWTCKDPDREPDLAFPLGPLFGHLVYECGDPYIHIIFLRGDHTYIQHYLRGEKGQIQLIFYVENFSKPGKPTVKQCGCRVISKEDVENWRKDSSGLNISKFVEINDNKRSGDEIEVEEPATSTSQN